MENLIIAILTGMLAGWLAGVIAKGSGFGLLGNLIVGVLGALVGGWVFRMLGIAPVDRVGQFGIAVVGALVLLFLIGLIRKKP
jgi:uncharacterized membrane protein YeaQ/YmgE (transglycosylase-associated protein family)